MHEAGSKRRQMSSAQLSVKGRETVAKAKKGKTRKGQTQDSLGGLKIPAMAGVCTSTGEQSIGPATLGLRPVGSTVPSNQVPSSVPGVTATLGAGESPYLIAAESGIDYTMEKRMNKKAEKAARKAARRTLLAKSQRAPLQQLARLELLAGQLRPNDPLRMRAAAVVLKEKLMMSHTAGTSGLAKAVADAGGIDSATAIASALTDVERALGIGDSATHFQPAQIDPRAQLQRIMSGQGSESMQGRQDSGALTMYSSPAAALGQVLKGGLGEQLAAAEAEVAKAEASGNSNRLTAAHEQLTRLRLTAAHRVRGVN